MKGKHSKAREAAGGARLIVTLPRDHRPSFSHILSPGGRVGPAGTLLLRTSSQTDISTWHAACLHLQAPGTVGRPGLLSISSCLEVPESEKWTCPRPETGQEEPGLVTEVCLRPCWASVSPSENTQGSEEGASAVESSHCSPGCPVQLAVPTYPGLPASRECASLSPSQAPALSAPIKGETDPPVHNDSPSC